MNAENNKNKIVDHLFRHQFGKMVAILSSIFGLTHLELIEDAVQDTFIKATLQWRNGIPDKPEAWLIKAAKNRVIDLIRKINSERERQGKISIQSPHLEINTLFLDHEVEDSQLRMIFVACHPSLSKEEQIAFSLKTISGFSMKEIAAAFLLKEETIKKRLSRARKKIVDQNISLSYPAPTEVSHRMNTVLQVIYLIFNEGFHSARPDRLIDKELCGEALRLCKLLLLKEKLRSGSLYAIFALCCFHSSRIEAKITSKNEIVDLEFQDRSKWYLPLIILGNDALRKSHNYDGASVYRFEALIAAEHVKAIRFENTNWSRILELYHSLYELNPSPSSLLAMATVHLQLDQLSEAKVLLDSIPVTNLNQRRYLLNGCYAQYYYKSDQPDKALKAIDESIRLCTNALEKRYLVKKREKMSHSKK